MKVILLAVISLDGFLTKGNDSNIYTWTSKEDQRMYFTKIETATVIVMGSKTYDAARHFMKYKKGRIRVILTKNPMKFKKEEIVGQIEFTSDSPKEIVKRFKSHKEICLVGGAETISSFLKQKMIHEIHLTIEPLLFGSGKKLLDGEFDVKLKLLSLKKLNSKGTLFLKYKVNY